MSEEEVRFLLSRLRLEVETRREWDDPRSQSVTVKLMLDDEQISSESFSCAR